MRPLRPRHPPPFSKCMDCSRGSGDAGAGSASRGGVRHGQERHASNRLAWVGAVGGGGSELAKGSRLERERGARVEEVQPLAAAAVVVLVAAGCTPPSKHQRRFVMLL